MEPYRKRVDLPTDSDYWFVELGPVPDMPAWHQEMYSFSSYAFPTKVAANLFASNHQRMYPGREIKVRQGG